MTPGALLIDLDGVIRRWCVDDAAIERAHGLPAGAIRRAAFAPVLLTPAITGKIDDLRWRAGITETLRSMHGATRAAAAVAEWSSGPGEVDDDVLAILRRCRTTPLVLVTNATSRLAADLGELGIASLFHHVVNSSEIGVAKPDRGIFDAALAVARVRASEALFVDDSLANVHAAARIGIQGHHFVGHPELLSFLEAKGVLAPA